MQNKLNSYEIKDIVDMLQYISLPVDPSDPFYHQVQEAVTHQDVYFRLSLEEQPQIQEATVQDDLDALVESD